MSTTMRSSLEVDGKTIFEGLGEIILEGSKSTSVPYGGGWTKYTFDFVNPVPPGRYICFIQVSYANLAATSYLGCYAKVPGFGDFYVHKYTNGGSGVDNGSVWASVSTTLNSMDFYWQQTTTSGGNVAATMTVQFMKIR